MSESVIERSIRQALQENRAAAITIVPARPTPIPPASDPDAEAES